MKVRYIDAHCHLQFDQYDADRDALVEQMREKGIMGIVVGCDYESSRSAVELAEKRDHLYASVGHHPNHKELFDEQGIRALLTNPKVIAIGECGLDYFRLEQLTDELKDKQKELFKKQIALATEFDKPLILHIRPTKNSMDAYQDAIGILKEAKSRYPNLRGDVHFFVGGRAEAEALIALGFTLSFTAVITFARDYDDVIRAIPLMSILSETDSPYVAPASRRGQRNDPLAVTLVVAKIAEIRGGDLEEVRQTLLANAQKMFSL